MAKSGNESVTNSTMSEMAVDYEVEYDSDDDSDNSDSEAVVTDEITKSKHKVDKLFTKQDCARIVQCLRLDNDVATSDEVRDLKLQIRRLEENFQEIKDLIKAKKI